MTTPAVRYYKGTKKLKKAPSAVGTYTAKITLGKATAKVTYTIAKKNDYARYEENKDAISRVQPVQNEPVACKNGKIRISWTVSEGCELTSYQIYRATAADGTYTKVGTVKAGKQTFTNSKNLKKGKTYYYKVRGIAKFGSALSVATEWSDVQSAKCRKTVK